MLKFLQTFYMRSPSFWNLLLYTYLSVVAVRVVCGSNHTPSAHQGIRTFINLSCDRKTVSVQSCPAFSHLNSIGHWLQTLTISKFFALAPTLVNYWFTKAFLHLSSKPSLNVQGNSIPSLNVQGNSISLNVTSYNYPVSRLFLSLCLVLLRTILYLPIIHLSKHFVI